MAAATEAAAMAMVTPVPGPVYPVVITAQVASMWMQTAMVCVITMIPAASS